jgi:DNA-binding HxlR family transcriptional regulator
MTLSPSEYLSRKGTIELLCELSPEGSRFEELLDELPISRPTLSNRLTEGREVSFLEPRPIASEREGHQEYVFTPRGATIRVLLFQQGLVLEYQQYKLALKQFEAGCDKFKEGIETNPPNLGNSNLNEENLRTIIQRSDLSEMAEE